MFTGIIEAFAKVKTLNKVGENLQIKFECNLAEELKIDQSVSHNGVCLTVEKCEGKYYSVTAIKETLDKTNLGLLQIGDFVNIERSLKIGDRLDGHIVQGHVDQIAKCVWYDPLFVGHAAKFFCLLLLLFCRDACWFRKAFSDNYPQLHANVHHSWQSNNHIQSRRPIQILCYYFFFQAPSTFL